MGDHVFWKTVWRTEKDARELQTALKAKGLESFWTAYGVDGKQPAGNAVAGK